MLSNLASALRTLFSYTGQLDLLEEAVNLLRQAVASAAPDRAAMLSNLAVALLDLFSRSGDVDALDEAVSLLREALASSPPGHPDAGAMLSNLGVALSRRFERLGARRPGCGDRRGRQALASKGHGDQPSPGTCQTSGNLLLAR